MKKNLEALSDPIQRLCSMKNQVQLTAHQLETWVAVLSCYDADIVARVCLEKGLSADPFPDLGKLAIRCEEHRLERNNLDSSGNVSVGENMLQKIADSLQLTISGRV